MLCQTCWDKIGLPFKDEGDSFKKEAKDIDASGRGQFDLMNGLVFQNLVGFGSVNREAFSDALNKFASKNKEIEKYELHLNLIHSEPSNCKK